MEEEFDETTVRAAYSKAMKLKRSGLENEIIYARLEKQGIPEPLIHRVLNNVGQQQRKVELEEREIDYKIAAIKMGFGIVIAGVSALLLPGMIIIPIGLIVGGGVLAITTSKK